MSRKAYVHKTVHCRIPEWLVKSNGVAPGTLTVVFLPVVFVLFMRLANTVKIHP